MMTINDFLRIPYVYGGRDMAGMDCYGLVREARHALFGRGLMPICSDAKPGHFREITRACEAVSGLEGMRPSDARPGAIATAWRASLCVHVGIVVEADGRIWVLETDKGTGPCLTPIPRFEQRYTKVVYYAD